MKFKARAECLIDILAFIGKVQPSKAKYQPTVLPDYEIVFESDKDLDTIIGETESLMDCHVIAQTVKPFAQYTGER